jgi:hypothetical protein
MDDGEWISLARDDGAIIAAVCIHDRLGQATILSELGDRLVEREDGTFESVHDRRRFRPHDARTAAPRAPRDYRVAFAAGDGFARLVVDGDFRHSSSIGRAWDAAFAAAADLDLRRLLLVRGPGRVASALVNLAQLHDFGARGHVVERVAVMLDASLAGHGEMFATVAVLRGFDVKVFEDEQLAVAWLRE